MADHCSAPPPLNFGSRKEVKAYRRVLGAVLAINAVMFAVEIGAGVAAGSASLQADSLDFLGDAANYAISLLVVGMALRYRAAAALAKGMTMAAFGTWVIATVIWHSLHGTLRALSLWGPSAWQPWPPMPLHSACSGLTAWRREYAVSMDLYAQRRAWQHRGTARSGWRVRDRHRVARRYGGRDHGWAGDTGSFDGYPEGSRKTTHRKACSG